LNFVILFPRPRESDDVVEEEQDNKGQRVYFRKKLKQCQSLKLF